MRLVALVFLGLTCCDALAERIPSGDDVPPDHRTPISAGSSGSASTAGRAGIGGSFQVPVLTIGGAPVVEPEPDWCETAERNGATFCSADKPNTLEYCEPVTLIHSGDGAGGDGAGGAAGDTAGGNVGSSLGGQTCIGYDRPPEWAYDLVIQCYAHCGVGIAMSQRVLEGSCCYKVTSEYYGR